MSNTSIARASVGRSIPSAPLRILDAPDLVDDYYLNLISWGHNNVSRRQAMNAADVLVRSLAPLRHAFLSQSLVEFCWYTPAFALVPEVKLMGDPIAAVGDINLASFVLRERRQSDMK